MIFNARIYALSMHPRDIRCPAPTSTPQDVRPVQHTHMCIHSRNSRSPAPTSTPGDFDDLGFIMGLERQGAIYRADMEHSGSVYGIGSGEAFDPDAPMDLIAQTRSDLALARRYGQDTERLSTHLFKLEEAQMTCPVATATVSTPQLAETLVLFQAQRLWIE